MQTLAEYLQETPYTLALSSGFFGFFAHAGFVKALQLRNIQPQTITGSSAGAVIGAAWASGIEMTDFIQVLTSIRKEDFWDPGIGFGFLKGQKATTVFEKHFPNEFSKLKIPLKVSVFDIFKMKTQVLQTGSVALACRASCSVPGLFHPAKINGRYYSDGGVRDKAALNGISTESHILCHHLRSQKVYDEFELDPKTAARYNKLKTIELKDLPRSGPNRLHLAKEIIEIAHQQTNELLDKPL